MRVAQVIERTEAEGPGARFAVWVQGCPIRCPGCCNPEMFPAEGGVEIDPRELADRAARAAAGSDVEGVTLLGGEPFAQADACASFARAARAAGLSVMVFSGYALAELEERARAEETGVRELLDACDLLVDGRFEKDELDASRRWIGSRNQTLHFRSARYAPDDPRFRAPQTAEVRLENGVVTMNGWPALVPAIKRSPGGKARG